MTVTALVPSASFWPWRGIDSEFQSEAVNIVAEFFHVREAIIRMNEAFGIALSLPAIIDVDVGIPGRFHTALYHGRGIGADNLVRDLATVLIRSEEHTSELQSPY